MTILFAAFHGRFERAKAGTPFPQVQRTSNNRDFPLDQVHSLTLVRSCFYETLPGCAFLACDTMRRHTIKCIFRIYLPNLKIKQNICLLGVPLCKEALFLFRIKEIRSIFAVQVFVGHMPMVGKTKAVFRKDSKNIRRFEIGCVRAKSSFEFKKWEETSNTEMKAERVQLD